MKTMANTSYKELHENFISNQVGTDSIEVILLLFYPTLCGVLSALIRLRWNDSRGFMLPFILEHAVLIIPAQLGQTLFSNNHVAAFIGWILFGVFWCFVSGKSSSTSKENGKKSLQEFITCETSRDISYTLIQNVRASICIMTAIAILAVDFKIFPRRFCKTETFGTGPMDTGVGFFLISNAVVSKEAKGKSRKIGSSKRIIQAVVSSLPLIALGFLRLMGTKSVEYQEHVTEYGVHWNFFFSLASVKVMSTVMFSILPSYLWMPFGVISLIGYQYILKYWGLEDFILQGETNGGRDGFVKANREGIFSSIGYLSLFMIGACLIGKRIFNKKRTTIQEWLKLFLEFLVMTIFSWASYACYTSLTGDLVSRRLANLPFVLWMISLSLLSLTWWLGGTLFVEYFEYYRGLKKKEETGINLLEVINKHGLCYFLLANILTGLVNIFVKTLYVSDISAFIILSIYMLILSISIFIFYSFKKSKLKF